MRIFPVSICCGLWNYDGQCANATQRTSEHFQYTFNKVWLFFSFFSFFANEVPVEIKI